MAHGFLGTIGWIKGNLMTSSQASEKGYNNDNFYPGAPNIPDSEPVLKSILPAMTSNTAPSGYAASASDICSGWGVDAQSQPYLAFDKVRGSRWLGNHYSTWNPRWLQIKLPEAQEVRAYSIDCFSTNSTDTENKRKPKSVVLKGSNDGQSFDTLDSQQNIPDWNISDTTHQPILFKLKKPVNYQYYRLEITEPQGQSGETAASKLWDVHIHEFDLLK